MFLHWGLLFSLLQREEWFGSHLTGSYLECQDFWRISGIERDVYIYSQPKVAIRDFRVTSTLDDTYKNGIFKLAMDIRNNTSQPSKDYVIGYKVLDPKTDKVIAAFEMNTRTRQDSLNLRYILLPYR